MKGFVKIMKIGNLPVDFDNEGAEYIVNRKGAKVFMDESKQPILDLCEGSTVKTVLSVGFSKSQKPMATIKENNEAICYILPDWYLDWCKTCVEMAMSGMNLFPSDVKFTKHEDKYSADIL